MANTLFMRLEGPMQAWGERARWSVRDTAPEPTKSGVVGLLACAQGLHEDADVRRLSQEIDIGVRCDHPGQRLVDYHTVSGGVMSAEGKIKVNATTKERETVVSWRSYLCDAAFLVAVRADERLVAELAEALQAPHWPIFLGRKSCPPSRTVFDGVGDYASIELALATVPLRIQTGGRDMEELTHTDVRAVITCGPEQSTGIRRRDEINALSRRTYLPRYTRDVLLHVPVQYD